MAQGACIPGQAITARAGFSNLAAVVPQAQIAVSPGPIFTDQTDVTQAPNPATADAYGNYNICAAAGTTQTLTVSGPNMNTLVYKLTFPSTISGVTSSGNNTFSGTNIFTSAVTTTTLNNTQNAAEFPGADIFAQANAAASVASPNGVVIIPPGTYSNVTTTLNGVSGVVFMAYGATVNFTGSSGNAMSFKSVTKSGIYGLTLNGPNVGTTVGLYVGNSVANSGQTLYNSFVDLLIGGNDALGLLRGFFYGVQVDGTTSAGTYQNTFTRVSVYASLSHGWHIVPTTPIFANANKFEDCYAQHGASDGVYIDGGEGNTFVGLRSETNGGYGVNLGFSQQTYGDQFLGGWYESNTNGSFQFSGNTFNTFVIAAHLADATQVNDPVPNTFRANTVIADASSVAIGVPFSKGTPIEYARSDQTGLGANVSTTTLFNPPSASFTGLYRASCYTIVTRAATTSSTLPACTVVWTDNDNATSQSFQITTTNTGNSLTTLGSSTVIINASSAAAITYSTTGYTTSGATSMQYSVHIVLERL